MPPQSPKELFADPEFRKLPQDSQRKVLQQSDPEYASLPDAAQMKVLQEGFVGAPPAVLPKVGFIGEAGKQLKELGTGLKSLLPGQTAEPISGIVKGMTSLVGSTVDEAMGNPQAGKSVLTAPQNPVDRLTGAFLTMFGADMPAARAHKASGETGASVADIATIPLVTLGTGELLKKALPKGEPSVTKRATRLARATGAENAPVNIMDAYKKALPDLMETQKVSGLTSTTPADLGKLVGETLDRTENEYNMRLQGIANNPIVPDRIADEIELEAKKFDTPNPESQSIKRELQNKAATFRRPWTMRQIDLERRNAYGRLHGFERKTASGQRAALRTDSDIIADQIIEKGMKDIAYSELEKANPQLGADYFRKLKQRQSAMLDVSDQMSKQLVKLGNLEAYDTLIDRLRGHSYVSSGGHVGFAIGNLMSAPVSESFKAGRQVRKGLAPPSNIGRARALTSLVPITRQSQPSLAPDEEEFPNRNKD